MISLGWEHLRIALEELLWLGRDMSRLPHDLDLDMDTQTNRPVLKLLHF